ncbi:DNA translocase FtsK [Anoxynatronum buryatiense]|uniref:DNA translocase FtsK n=1 Tax=Anoxynatronum buryatiense TaxID=489973 RepID=A0AA45WUF2_9CLOT|nr:DNA translocase FtsK [Anoxynatronum buryatiense]SMP47755.1 DNA translocase FtsK [Anoxynatronum buryatiense]
MKQQSSDKNRQRNGSQTGKNPGRRSKAGSAGKSRGHNKRRIPLEIVGILSIGFFLFALFAMHTKSGGFIGIAVRWLFFALLGWMAYPYVYLFLVTAGLILFKVHHRPNVKQRVIMVVIVMMFFHMMAGLLDASLLVSLRNEDFGTSLMTAIRRGALSEGTGFIGTLLLYWPIYLLGRTGTAIFLISVTLAVIWLVSPQLLVNAMRMMKRFLLQISDKIKMRKEQKLMEASIRQPEVAECSKTTPFVITEKEADSQLQAEEAVHFQMITYEPKRSEQRKLELEPGIQDDAKKTGEQALSEKPFEETLAATLKEPGMKKSLRAFQLPALSLLKGDQLYQPRTDRRQMLAKAKLLEETLESFGVAAKVIKVSQGPTITRYELQPSRGVKVSKVVNLSDDIALNLAASSIRIEAPIPGKAAIGIEIPNDQVAMVDLKELLSATEYQTLQAPLPFALGRNIAGDPMVFDINKMPHLLVAGATGSGKSVCINTLILSLLFRAKPDEVKLLMIDPKVVELNQYNGIPHLMIPVVTDPKKATGALRWAVTEMEERYQRFAASGVRDIAGYNEKQKDDSLPYIVVIIDELADLMLVAAKEVEDYICRLAQMARAAGIHLIIATQRPSVDVITGIIKANIPSRIAFSVASQVDSRTILDMGGAEKLLGKGDMLFHPIGYNKPVRIQGAFVSDEEVKRVVDFLKSQSGGEPEYETTVMDKIESMPEASYEEESDDLFQEALRIAFDHQQISISMLQRRLKMGYNRAARLIDEMESKGYVGPNEGTKPRKVINRPSGMEEMESSSQKDH